jgi:hypothetical protein
MCEAATGEVTRTKGQAGAVRRRLGYLWRGAACAGAWVIGIAVGGGVLAAAGVQMPTFPATDVGPERMAQLQLLGALVLAAGIAPLASRLAGGFAARWLALAGFVWVAAGVCNGIECQFFTTLGKWHTIALMHLVPSLLFAALVAWLFPAAGRTEALTATGLRGRSLGQWLWRVPLALLAFPFAYYVFGTLLMTVAPGLVAYYRGGVAWLRIPDPAVIPLVQLLRSALFLVSTLPILALWRGRRGMLMVQLGLGSWVVVGLFGLVQAVWMPMALRVPHTLEILADSMVYAWLLVGLLVPARR